MRATTAMAEASCRPTGDRPRPVLAPAPRRDAATVPFIDRERESEELRAALETALGGSGRVVLVGGEPGVGKTRLAGVLAADAAARGVPVWWGRGWEDGSAPAFWPWNTALRSGIDRLAREAVATAAGSWGGTLAHVFPVLRKRLAEVPATDGWQSDGARFRMFDVVSRFLAAVARPSGLVLVLDDVHWADQPSLKLLEYVAADLADARVLVVATYRDTEVQRTDPCFDTLSRVAREPSARRLLLRGLSPAHCARWIALAAIPGDPNTLGAALHRETNGNPFLMGELVQLLADETDLATGWDTPRVPQGVREVVARRLDRLGPDCREALAVAALLRDTIDAAILAEVVEDARLADHLERAVADRILVPSEGRRGEYAFAHALIRRVLADDLAPSARSGWHTRIAAVLEQQAVTYDVATTELVHHLAAAGTPDALRRAFEHACRGADQAARGLGWEEAVRLYELALDVGRRSGQLDARRAVDLRLALARALRGAGDVPAARVRCNEVMTACRRTPDPEAFARAALLYAGAMPEWGRVEPAVRAVLEEASRGEAALDDALRARLQARLAGDLIAANEVEQSARVFALCDAAADTARRVGADGLLAVALTGSYFAAAMGMRRASGDAEIPSTQEMLAAAEAGGEHEYVVAIHYARVSTLLAIGEADGFSAECDALETAALASRVPEGLWLTEALDALRATLCGRFAEAADAMERALATGRRMQVTNAVGVYGCQRIMWHAFQGRLVEIEGEIEAFVEGHGTGPGWRPMRALARLARGDVVAARVEFENLFATGLAPAERGVMARCYLAGLAALCVALRDRERAAVLYDRIARRPDAWSVDGCETLGPWALLLGALARLCGRPTEAVRHFEEAIAQGRRMQSAPTVARAQSMLASLQLSLEPNREERTRITALLAEASQHAEELGLVDVTARVARLQAKLAQRPTEAETNVFRRDGDVWAIRFAGKELRLKDGKGPRYLATLLGSPGREVHVLQFSAGAVASSSVAAGAQAGLSIGALGGGVDDAPDQEARRAYRERIEDLRAELDEAEQFADSGRAEALRAELEQLMAQLAGRFGSRAPTRGPAETARKAVTKVLRTQIGRLLDVHPALGRHLRDTVRMGTVCVYAPPSTTEWDVTC